MEKRDSSPPPGGGITGQLRGLLNVNGSKTNMTLELREALNHLNLSTIDDLEYHFLATSCFLKPWTHFRDTWFLRQTQTELRASPPGRLQPSSLLRFYTCFLEGELRYDPRGDERSPMYTPDTSTYGTFDDHYWGVEEHEKMLYSWLLQEFRVGKSRNPFGLVYFEHRNIITAWKTVFVPIVNAVRDSYDIRGRRYYGRLARFIESRHPSRLAFPAGYVPASMSSTTSYRLVPLSRMQGSRLWAGASAESRGLVENIVAKKEYASFEKELRDVYPKYGQVVERPKFKTRMEDWLASQKLRTQQKLRDKELHSKTTPEFVKREGDKSLVFGCRGLENPENNGTAQYELSPASVPRRSMSYSSATRSGRTQVPAKLFDETPTKRTPYGMHSFRNSPVQPKDVQGVTEPRPDKSPRKSAGLRHSVECRPGQTPLEFDLSRSFPDQSSFEIDNTSSIRLSTSTNGPCAGSGIADKPNLGGHGQGSACIESDVDLCDKIRNSNPWDTVVEETVEPLDDQRKSESSEHMSAMPSPLFNQKDVLQKKHYHELAKNSKDSAFVRAVNKAKARAPSYEGSDYGRDIPSFFNENSTVLPRDERGIAYQIPQRVPWPGQSPDFPPRQFQPRSESDDDISAFPPPVPEKDSRRNNSFYSLGEDEKGSQNSFEPPLNADLGPRIVSVENIRAHLSITPQTSQEDVKQAVHPAKKSGRMLRPYNSHMFPKRRGATRDTSENWDESANIEAVGSYEMKVLDQRQNK